MIAFKLFRLKKNGEITSLFINKSVPLRLNTWMKAFNFPTKGFQVRPGWHSLKKKSAPHLSKQGRVWAEVEIRDFTEHTRPKSQGGIWFLSKWIKIKKLV